MQAVPVHIAVAFLMSNGNVPDFLCVLIGVGLIGLPVCFFALVPLMADREENSARRRMIAATHRQRTRRGNVANQTVESTSLVREPGFPQHPTPRTQLARPGKYGTKHRHLFTTAEEMNLARHADCRNPENPELAEQSAVLRPRDLDEHGISRKYLGQLCQAGLLRRIGRGLYVLPEPNRPKTARWPRLANAFPAGSSACFRPCNSTGSRPRRRTRSGSPSIARPGGRRPPNFPCGSFVSRAMH